MALESDNVGQTLPDHCAASAAGETVTEDPAAPGGEETLCPDGASGAQSTCGNGGALDPVASSPSGSGGEGSEETLAHADEWFEKGSKAIEDGDFVEAVDCLSRALEIRVVHYGELAQECASSYYKYGCALLFKAQEEADPLGNAPKSNATNLEKAKSVKSMEGGETSKAADIEAGDNEEPEGGCNGKGWGDGNAESEEDGKDSAEADEDEPDLDLAWKMLDIARAIVEKQLEDSMEKVNIFSALGEVSMEREDIETSLDDYLKALSILERVVEPDHRRVVELNFRICLVLEVGSKIGEAILYCQKAISLCKSRIQKLEDAKATDEGSRKSDLEDETGLLTGILTELEKKLEDLEQAMPHSVSAISEVIKMLASNSSAENNLPDVTAKPASLASSQLGTLEDLEQAMPNSVSAISEVIKMLASNSSAENNLPDVTAKPASLASSQLGTVSNGFDSPTISTAGTPGSSAVTHLGVVGRGVKRATVKPSGAESAPKRRAGDLSAEQADSGTSEVLGPATHETESVSN